MAIPRKVIVHPEVQRYIDEEARKFTRVRHVFDALVYRIARRPEEGLLLPGYNSIRYLIKSQAFRLPVPLYLKLLYQFDETSVVVEFAQVEDPNESDPTD